MARLYAPIHLTVYRLVYRRAASAINQKAEGNASRRRLKNLKVNIATEPYQPKLTIFVKNADMDIRAICPDVIYLGHLIA
jgi:hypothetical protein